MSELIDNLKCECGHRQMCSTGYRCYQSGIQCIDICSCAAMDHVDICKKILKTLTSKSDQVSFY